MLKQKALQWDLPRILTILILMCKKGGGNNPKLNKIIDPQSIDCVLAAPTLVNN